jgi:hypothetical protein
VQFRPEFSGIDDTIEADGLSHGNLDPSLPLGAKQGISVRSATRFNPSIPCSRETIEWPIAAE